MKITDPKDQKESSTLEVALHFIAWEAWVINCVWWSKLSRLGDFDVGNSNAMINM